MKNGISKSTLALSGLLSLSLTQLACANGNWLLRADLGLLWPDSDNNMTVNNGSNFLPPANVDQFSLRNKQNQFMPAIATGYRWYFNDSFFTAYSLMFRYQHIFPQTLKGNITQYSLPEFNNYTYRWRVNSDVISVYSKINLGQYKRVMPYVDAGIGSAFNHGGNYQETALPGVTARFSPAFASRTKTTFAYNVGLGLDMMLTPQVILSLGYNYQSFGQFTSGTGKSTWSANHLNSGNFTANTALLSLTYLFEEPSQPLLK